ncbi:MAG: hypothetical protein FWF71_05730 [Actinomycetia bacterium]|nr:hypothetical protein [Actinomycetes bacterium]
MQDYQSLADVIESTGVPIALIAFGLAVFLMLFPTIKRMLEQTVERGKVQMRQTGEINELIRNCTSVIDNNTATMALLLNDRKMLSTLIETHMAESRALLARLEDGQGRILVNDAAVLSNGRIIIDRLERLAKA